MYRTGRTTAATATAVVLAATGGLLTALTAPAAAAGGCATNTFTRQIYANTTFSGTPKKTDCDKAVAENWGSGSPATGVPSNNFGVRWTLTRDFGSGGPFAFSASTQDGIRVYLDGVRKIDLWKNVSSNATKTLNLTIPRGKHTLRVDYVNFTGTANVKFAYAPRTAPSVDKVAPLAPTGVTATYDEATGRAKVAWARNKEMDVAGYRVYRADEHSAEFLLASDPHALVTGTSWAQPLSPTGAGYLYEVRAVDRAGNESRGSADQFLRTPDRLAPTLTAPTGSHDNWLGVSLEWTADEQGLTFDVYRASDPAGEFSRLATVSTPAHRDETAPYGETSYYRVTATDAAGNTTTSPVLEFHRPAAVPSLSGAVNNTEDTGIQLSWTSPAAGPSEFRVYRWDRSDETSVPEPIACAPYRTGDLGDPRPQYACDDLTAELGRSYGYRVHTVDALGRESEPSQPAGVTRADRFAPPAVTGLAHTSTEYGTELRWDESPAPDLGSYVVHRAPADDPATLTRIATLEPGTTRYADVQVADDESWVYYVDAVDVLGHSLHADGSPAEVARVEVNEYHLAPGYNIPFTYDWSLTAATEANRARLSWTCTTGSCTAAGFHVYRWNRVTETWDRLTEQPLPGDTRTYTDAATPSGTTSHYAITAVAANGTELGAPHTSVATAPTGA
ncbi:PA14 domain-containing protein [Streptomyces sp. enrichment culture]|uniref:PA14 domain-containing protein n=1 Tax=Streptomyces sp. enrichment culture TaxID=1795815 RepID=UPI003F570CB8